MCIWLYRHKPSLMDPPVGVLLVLVPNLGKWRVTSRRAYSVKMCAKSNIQIHPLWQSLVNEEAAESTSFRLWLSVSRSAVSLVVSGSLGNRLADTSLA